LANATGGHHLDMNNIDTTSATSEINRRLDELTQRLDRLEAELPALPAKALGLTRATAHRVNDTAAAVVDDVGRQLGRLSATANSALATTVGQARSAVDRTASTARRTGKETIGQAQAQADRTAGAAEQAGIALLDDATRGVEPDGAGTPAALDEWTKADLYERAQELDIDGRSSMSKRELIAALRSA
jgi:hypothetical protein